MEQMWVFFDLIILFGAGKVLYAYYKLKFHGLVDEQVLLTKDIPIKSCKDLDGMKKFIEPKMLVFGIGLLVFGIFMVVSDTIGLPMPIVAVMYGASIVLIVWYGLMLKKLKNNFF